MVPPWPAGEGHGSASAEMADLAESALVRRFWALYQARRWAEAQALLAPEACCTWWATRERFIGAAAVVHVNAVYPEGWTIRLLELRALSAGRVHSLVRVDHGEASFYANSFFTLEGGRIAGLDEYWSDVQAPPSWRQGLPGRGDLPADMRPGLDLSLAPDAAAP
ncbi:nuclear transport factor 2 family protein [Roseateles sp. DAIF2]|uniref:nuclear transport factor 2 family protein n=1 Tax=Roseateles sp. DAIF2 TaxID=2714952 RepID=UPI0018A3017C|nr:nuclear transport factor 2 family protein [Roseateles sp. DAIF2]QPF76087.1 nuclear transport factor 2 family protein [Roseateles sp. DAIF2]